MAQDKKLLILSPYISVRDAKKAGYDLDYLIEIQWFNLKNIIFDEVLIENGYERELGDYYFSNDYRIKFNGFYAKDYRRDDRNIHNTSLGYFFDLNRFEIGTEFLKSELWYLLGSIRFTSDLLDVHYSVGKSKSIIDARIEYTIPMYNFWIVDTYISLMGKYYHESERRQYRQFTLGTKFILK